MQLKIFYYGASRFNWGNTNLINKSMIRQNYLQALREADKHNYKLLCDFVRSS